MFPARLANPNAFDSTPPPGIEFDIHPMMVYADVAIPVLEDFRGNQLVAPELFKLIVSYSFQAGWLPFELDGKGSI
jgi:hypothetical protein